MFGESSTHGVLTVTTVPPTILRLGYIVEGSLMNQEPSQVSREGIDPNVQSTGSVSASPKGTFLDPVSIGSDIGADRQPDDNESNLSDE